MKKLLSSLVCLTLFCTLLVTTPVKAAQTTSVTPYLNVLSELNAKYGTSVTIPKGTADYDDMGKLSLTDFKTKMEADCVLAAKIQKDIASQSKQNSTNSAANTTSSDNVIHLDSVRDSITQHSISENSSYIIDVYMQSNVFSGTGVNGTYTYNSITGFGYIGYTNKAFFKGQHQSYSLSADRKTCSVTYSGTVAQPSGTILLVSLKVIANYSANATSGSIGQIV